MAGPDLESSAADGITGALIRAGPRHRVASSPVSLWAIRNWCNAIGLQDARYGSADNNPNAKAIAPQPMLQSWAGQGLSRSGNSSVPSLHHDVRSAFRKAGFGSVIATNYEQTYLSDLHVGDVVEERSWIEHVSPKKRTKLGTGHFVKIAFEFCERTSQRLVGRQTATTFYFVPEHRPDVSPESGILLPVFQDPVTIDVTPTLIIAGSIASNDFERVHHDVASAKTDGLPDIIASIITSAGLSVRYLLNTIRPGHCLKSLDLRLGAPAFPGDVLTLSHQLLGREDGIERVRIVGTTRAAIHLDTEIAITPPGSA